MTKDRDTLDEAIADMLASNDFVVAIADALVRNDLDTAAALIQEYKVLVDARRAKLASAGPHGNHHTSQPSQPPHPSPFPPRSHHTCPAPRAPLRHYPGVTYGKSGPAAADRPGTGISREKISPERGCKSRATDRKE